MEQSKKQQHFSLVAFTFVLVSALLASSLTNAYANSTNKKETLPDFLEDLLIRSLPNATNAEINRVRKIWIDQFNLNEEKREYVEKVFIKSLDSKSTYGYMTQVVDLELFGVWAQVYNPTNMEGAYCDDAYSRFYTPLNNSGASEIGSTTPDATGIVMIAAKLAPSGEGQNGNYFIVNGNNVSDKYDENWVLNPIGYGKVTHPSDEPGTSWIYIGYTTKKFNFVSIGVTTAMGGLCTYNDVLGDCIGFWEE